MPDDSTLSMLVMLGVMGLAFWFLLIRPAQKKQKAQQELITQLGPGSRIMTTAGVIATVREMGERTAVLEISPGVEMTVLRQAIMRAVEPSEEEFEYDEDAAADDDAPSEADALIDAEADAAQAESGVDTPAVDEAPTTFDPQRPSEPGSATN